MSLRSFHIFFVVIAVLADFGIAAWSLTTDSPKADQFRGWGIGLGIFGVLMLAYLVRFIIKSRRVLS